MRNEEVAERLGGVLHMTLPQARRLSRLFEEEGFRDVLELGFCHGVSTCYMAAALARNGGGSIVTIDLERARMLEPNIETLLTSIGERERVEIHYEPTSYTWRLMKLIEEDPEPRYDFCYIDGAHSWYHDGFAFFLVDRLLRPGGWILFDDLDWTYEGSESVRNEPWVRRMPAEERATPQVRKVYELLVRQHAGYDSFSLEGSWAFARKRRGGEAAQRQIIIERIMEREEVGIGAALLRVGRALRSIVRPQHPDR
jgi:predicted O-methyltransferase YrrM